MAVRPSGRAGRIELACDLVVILAVAVILMLPPLFRIPPDGHSYHYNAVWITTFADELSAGVPYPRWLGSLWSGLGGADFFFYAPLPFWLAGAVRSVACQSCGADQLLVLTGVTLLALSGISFWVLARRFAMRGPALAAAILYMALPYHLGADWYDRQALGEFAAAAILPVHLLAFLDCLAGRGGGPRLALLSSLLLLCHLPSAMVAAVGYLCVMVFGARPRGWRPAAAAALAGGLGLGIAAIYWYPAITLLDSVRNELLALPRVSWQLNLLMPVNLGRDAFFDSLWPPFAILSVVAIAAVILAGRSTPPTGRVALVLLATCWVMVTPLALPLWAATPVSRIQFPWRFLVLADLAFAMAALAALDLLARRAGGSLRLAAAGVLVGLSVAVSVAEHPEVRGVRGSSPRAADIIQASGGAVEWLAEETRDTIGTTSYWHLLGLLRAERADAEVARLDGPGSVRAYSETPRRLTLQVDAPEAVTVTVQRTYWRHWRLTDQATGREMTIAPAAGFPVIEAELPAGKAEYVLELPWLPAERTGGVLSALSLLLLLGWWLGSRRWKAS